MSDITFLQYTPHKEKKRPSHGGGGACVNCRKAHAACNSHRPCDRCVRMHAECQAYEKKQKKPDPKGQAPPNFLDVDTVSQMLFSDASKPVNPSVQDPFALPSPLSSYIHDPNESANFVAYNELPSSSSSTPSPPIMSPGSFSNAPAQSFPTTPESSVMTFINPQPFSNTMPPTSSTASSLLLNQNTCAFGMTVNTNTPPPSTAQSMDLTPSAPTTTSTSAMVTSDANSKLDELMAQNARMEMCLASLIRKVDFLQAQIPVITRPGVSPAILPATATWKLPTCELLECNQAFLDILGYNAEDNAHMTFFQLGACKDAIAAVKKKIDHSIETNTPIKEPTHSDTIRIPMFKKNRECIMLSVTAIVCLDAPQPTLTTVLHKIPPPESG